LVSVLRLVWALGPVLASVARQVWSAGLVLVSVARPVWAVGLLLVLVGRVASPVVRVCGVVPNWPLNPALTAALGWACVVARAWPVKSVLAPALAYAVEPVLETVPVWEAVLL
jgi:hypothetical protein